jgi:methionine-rich copper-binding protein CopC
MTIRTIALALSGIVAAAPSALAHASLQRSNPPAGAHVPASPPALALFYSEAVVPHFSKVQVLDASGHAVPAGAPQAEHDGRELVVKLPPLKPGQYTVVWRVTARDTHKTHGAFRFTVGQ